MSGPPRKRLAAEAIIREALADGPAPCRTVNAALRAACISAQTARRARLRVGVVRWPEPRPGPRSTWWMEIR